MKNAPCARFGTRIRPKISEKPDDSRNRSPPKATLLSVWMIQNCHCIDVASPRPALLSATTSRLFNRKLSRVQTFVKTRAARAGSAFSLCEGSTATLYGVAGPGNAKTVPVAAVHRAQPPARRRTKISRLALPGAPTQHAAIAIAGRPGRSVGRSPLVAVVIAVLDPIP